MKCFYHNDLDGIASAAIVNHFVKESCDYIEVGYSKEFPFEQIAKDELVYIVDFSIKEWDRLLVITENIVWIDHHKSAIELYADYSYLDGIRSVAAAACELTWMYFRPELEAPLAIQLLGDYDIWKFAFGEITEHFQIGMQSLNFTPADSRWDSLLLSTPGCSKEIIKRGEVIKEYRDSYYKKVAKATAFYSNFNGYRVLCCNGTFTGSHLLESIDKSTYDLMAVFNWDGVKWSVSLYSTKPEVDCSELAVKYDGGGHRGAAGFRVKHLPFKKLRDKTKKEKLFWKMVAVALSVAVVLAVAAMAGIIFKNQAIIGIAGSFMGWFAGRLARRILKKTGIL